MAATLWLIISLALAAVAGQSAQSAWNARRRAHLRREAVRLRLHYQEGEIPQPAERWTYLRELGEGLRVDEVFKGLGDRPPLVVLSVRHRVGPLTVARLAVGEEDMTPGEGLNTVFDGIRGSWRVVGVLGRPSARLLARLCALHRARTENP